MKQSFARALRIAFALSLAGNAAFLVPFTASEHFRWQYQQTLAIGAAQVRSPQFVFAGDSITAGGREFGRLDTINLGSNGLTTRQVARAMPQAASYRPRHIVVMAGTNDAITGTPNEAGLRADWRAITSDPRTVVVLAPPTSSPELNARIARSNAIAGEVARAAGRPVIDLPELRGPDGLIREDLTIDGIHLTPAAYRYWRSRLRRLS